MSIGRHGQVPIYFVEGSSGHFQLGASGVLMSLDCRWRDQVNAAASKANRGLCMMRNILRFWTDDISSKSEIQILENVQHRATRTVESGHLSYEVRLARLNISTLKNIRERGDFIKCYKIVQTKSAGSNRQRYYTALDSRVAEYIFASSRGRSWVLVI